MYYQEFFEALAGLPEFGFRLSVAFAAEIFHISMKQIKRVLWHALLLSIIIAGFWLLDSLKDPIFSKIVGLEYQPLAKIASVLSTLVVVCIYDLLTSLAGKENLFNIVSCFFGIFFVCTYPLLADPDHGLEANHENKTGIVGWVIFCAIEAYGSLMVALFWSFTNSLMDLEEAKGAYGLIISCAQIGAIIGSTLATRASTIGIPILMLVSGVSILTIPICIKGYHITFPINKSHKRYSIRIEGEAVSSLNVFSGLSNQSDSDAPTLRSFRHSVSAMIKHGISKVRNFSLSFNGLYEGLLLIFSHRYIILLFGMSTLYEIVLTILDYEFKLRAEEHSRIREAVNSAENLLTDPSQAKNSFADLLGYFGQVTNILSFCVSFFGFSFLVHRIGVRGSLLLFPTLMFAVVLIRNLIPSLWLLFALVSVLKALIFSLNDPVKELLYMPTSEDVKYKAKAWIDVFGSRLAKSIGSLLSTFASGNVDVLRGISELPMILVAILLIVVAYSIGAEFEYITDHGIIIGQLDDTSSKSETLAVRRGLRPGDVGYDGYSLELLEGVFDNDDDDDDDDDDNNDNDNNDDGGDGGGNDEEPYHLDRKSSQL
jgi:AAA family ATP:ADP antiporter